MAVLDFALPGYLEGSDAELHLHSPPSWELYQVQLEILVLHLGGGWWLRTESSQIRDKIP